MPVVQRAHWWTPFLMGVSLLIGISAALSHHFYYQSLNQKSTAIPRYLFWGILYADQQTNIAIGTAFAFLVKTSFVLAASTAYYQAFWKTNRIRKGTAVPPNLKKLDRTFSGPTSIISILTISTWFEYPLLFLVAATAWMIPIAAIFTPATLSITLLPNVSVTASKYVPQLDFRNLNYVAGMPALKGRNGPLTYIYDGSSMILKQIANSVAAQGTILPITDKWSNATWELDFSAPSLRCLSTPPVQGLGIQRNVAKFLTQGSQCSSPPTYLSWLSRPEVDPYIYQENASVLSFTDPSLPFKMVQPKSRNFQTLNTTLYLVTMPRMLQKRHTFVFTGQPYACNRNITFNGDIASNEPLGIGGKNMMILECRLHNSTYRTRFRYVNGIQNINVSVSNTNDRQISIINKVRGPRLLQPDETIFVQNECATLYRPTEEADSSTSCVHDESILSQLAYQSIYDTFSQLITGNITTNAEGTLTETSSVTSSILLNTKELFYLTDRAVHMRSAEVAPDLQKALSLTNRSEISGLSRLSSTEASRPLQDVLEELFQNFTISLMSSSLLQPNFTSNLSRAVAVDVTQYTSQTVYVYSAYRLWIAYGLATLFTSCAVAVGLVVVFTSNASYTNDFSTIFRIARAAELSIEPTDHDLDGASPIPTHIGNARVIIPRGPNEIHVMEHLRNRLSGSGSKGVHVTTALLDGDTAGTPRLGS